MKGPNMQGVILSRADLRKSDLTGVKWPEGWNLMRDEKLLVGENQILIRNTRSGKSQSS